MNRRSSAAALLFAAACVSMAGAQSQPAAAPSAQPPAGTQPPAATQPSKPADDRAALRARYERRLDETKRLQEKLEAAIKRLDGGEPVEQVRGTLPDGRHDGPRPRGGPDGPTGGPDHSPDHGPDRATDRHAPLDRAAVMDFLKANAPEVAQRLEDAAKENPQIGERIIMGRVEPQVREILGEKDADTKALRLADFKNGFATLSAMRIYGESLRQGKDVSAGESTLRELIGEHFDLQQKLREREIAVLEARIAQLRTEVQERQPQRDSFVAERVDRIKRGATRQRGDGNPPGGPKPPPANQPNK